MSDILNSHTNSASTHQETNFQFRFSEQFVDFLKAHNVSIAFSSHSIHKLFLIGRQVDKEEIAIAERSVNECRALSTRGDGEELLVSSDYQIWRFVNANPSPNPTAQLQAGEQDKVYIPQVGYTTGDCRIQDVGFNKEGNIIFVNTLFNCVAKASETSSFIPLWKPPFISDWVAEDRCHLSGLAFKEGDARYVTGFSQTDKANAWQQEMEGSGFVIDIKTNEVVCTGLSQPNSPRWYQDKLWLLNAGTGEFGSVDVEKKAFNPIALCQGYAQSLTFCGNFALIAVSLKSQKKEWVSTQLAAKLAEQELSPMCGMQWVDLRTGQSAPAFLAEGIIEEISGISVLANTHTPKLIGFKNDEIYRYIAFDRDIENSSKLAKSVH